MFGNTADRTPAEVFPPGEFLRDALEDIGWTQTELAEIIRRPVRVVNEIIAGKRSVTPETARELAAALGTSAQYWLNLETAYQLSKVSPADEEISREAKLRQRFPVREMVKRGWIKPSKRYEDLEQSIFSFFGIASLDAEISFNHAARRNYKEDVSVLQQAWLFRVRQVALACHVPSYSEAKLREALPELELLMTEPEEVRHVPRILTECGVRFLVVEPIPGSKINGVCFWVDNNRSPVIALTLKADQIDMFWFDLRHELEHVLRGEGKDEPIVDESDNERVGPVSESEQVANAAASDFCVPTSMMHSFIARHHPMYSEKSLIGFSRLVKRHPGIVAGQLQKRLNRWDLFRKHQVKVRGILVQSALTDGYGQTGPIDI